MFAIYKASVYLHIISAMFWIGGMLFTALVLAPASRKKVLADKRSVLFTIAGKQFSRLSWVFFAILTITGYIQLNYRGIGFENLLDKGFWVTGFGSALFYKLSLFVLVLILSVLHDFWLGPKAALLTSKQSDESQAVHYRYATRWIGRLNLLLGLLILYFAIILVRG